MLSIIKIRKLQKKHDLDQLQEWIESGTCWLLEGHVGRTAMDALRSGACFLPEQRHRDYYGNPIPSRLEVKPGTAGSIELSQNYWEENS